MTDEQRKVIQFSNCFQIPIRNKPKIPSLDERRLRAKLIAEELFETLLGLGFAIVTHPHGYDLLDVCGPNLASIADGLADLHYVAYCGTGACWCLDMEPIFAEVHRSNMTKLWTEMELLAAPKGWKKTKLSISSERCWIVSNKDGKVTKSPSYSPANIEAEIQKQIDRQP